MLHISIWFNGVIALNNKCCLIIKLKTYVYALKMEFCTTLSIHNTVFCQKYFMMYLGFYGNSVVCPIINALMPRSNCTVWIHLISYNAWFPGFSLYFLCFLNTVLLMFIKSNRYICSVSKKTWFGGRYT